MWLERVTHYLLQYRWQALAVAFVSATYPWHGYRRDLNSRSRHVAPKVLLKVQFLRFAATLPYVISYILTGIHGTAIPLVHLGGSGCCCYQQCFDVVFAVMLQRQAS